MAAGDNFPSVFSTLAEDVIKSGGDFQYHIDKYNGLDPDSEQSMRDMTLGGAHPPPDGGSIADHYFSLTGDPLMATNMALDDILGNRGGMQTDEQAKVNAAAQGLFSALPHDMIDQSLLSDVAEGFGVSSSSLSTAINDIGAVEGLDNPLLLGTPDNVFSDLPFAPPSMEVPLPPPSERFVVPPEHFPPTEPYIPPFDPTAGIGKVTEEFGIPSEGESLFPWLGRVGEEQLRSGVTTSGQQDIEDLQQLGMGWSELWDKSQFLLPRNWPIFQKETETSELQKLWDSGASRETMEDAAEAMLLADKDPEARALYEDGDSSSVIQMNQQIRIVMDQLDESQFEKEVESDPNIFAPSPIDMTLPTDVYPPGYIGDIGETQTSIDELASPELSAHTQAIASGVPMDSLTTGENIPPQWQDAPFSSIWDSYLQGVLPSYSPIVESAYSRAMNPTLGSFFLQPPGSATFPMGDRDAVSYQDWGNYLEAIDAANYPVLDWEQYDPQWDSIVDAVSNDGLDAQAVTNAPLWLGLQSGAKDLRRNAISIALARYYQGQPVHSSYASRAVESTLGTIYDRNYNASLQMEDANPAELFFTELIEGNPIRYGK
jgi:hypothetical protein